MKRVFDRSSVGQARASKLLHLRLGWQAVTDFFIDFHSLVATVGWNKEDLYETFLHWLSERVKDELTMYMFTPDLDGLMDWLSRLTLVCGRVECNNVITCMLLCR